MAKLSVLSRLLEAWREHLFHLDENYEGEVSTEINGHLYHT